MLLKSYSKEIFRPECNPAFESVHCIAHLNQDISMVFAARMAEGVKGSEDCPPMDVIKRGILKDYMQQFIFDA